MAWLRADTGLGLGEQKHLPGCSLQGGGSTAWSRGSSAAPKGTWAPTPFICAHKGANPKSTSPLLSCPEQELVCGGVSFCFSGPLSVNEANLGS